jgi:hypothetical protein
MALYPGTQLNSIFLHDDISRRSYDLVEISMPVKSGPPNNPIKLHKPGTAVNALTKILDKQSMFIQETALSRISNYFSAEFSGMPLITGAWLLQNLDLNALKTLELPKDCDLLIQIAIKNQESSNNKSSPRRTEDSDEIQVLEITAPKNLVEEFKKHILPGSLGAEQLIIIDEQYFPLNHQQIALLTTCHTCHKAFPYVIERLVHFLTESGEACKQSLKSGESNYQEGLDHYMTKKISELCSSSNSVLPELKCSACDAILDSPLKFCLHRDQHRYQSKLFTCLNCTEVLGSPVAFCRHDCTVKFISQKFETRRLKPNANVVLSSKGTLYKSLLDQETKTLLTCPACLSSFQYISRLLLHLATTLSCYKKVLLLDSQPDKRVILSKVLLGTRVLLKRITCDLCSESFDNQVTYMLHQDHHKFDSNEWAVCKGCNGTFDSSCSFHRHNCQLRKYQGANSLMWCMICEKYDQALNHTIAAAADENAEEMSLPQINSVHSLAADDLDHNHDQITTKIEIEEDDDEKPPPIIKKAEYIVLKNEHEIHVKDEPISQQSSDDCPLEEEEDVDERVNFGQQDSDWYICTDCDPYKILRDSDETFGSHSDTTKHYKVYPSWYYNKFDVKASNVAMDQTYGPITQHLLKELKESGYQPPSAAKKRRRHL